MTLDKQLEECNKLLKMAASSTDNLTEAINKIKRSNLSDFVKYYAFKHLAEHKSTNNQSASQTLNQALTVKREGPSFEQEACEVLGQIKELYTRIPYSDGEAFSQLLNLFSDYYADTSAAQEAQRWAENRSRSWFATAYDLAQSALSYAIRHPVQTTAIVLLAFLATANAKAAKSASLESKATPDLNSTNALNHTTSHADFIADPSGIVRYKGQAASKTYVELITGDLKRDPEIALRQKEVAEKLHGRIVDKTPKGRVSGADEHSSADIVKKIIETFQFLAEDPDNFCKIEGVFSARSAKIVVNDLNHPLHQQYMQNSLAFYDVLSNTIFIRLTDFSNKYLKKALQHELHHAHMAHQNTKMDRLQMLSRSTPVACGSSPRDLEECNVLKKTILDAKNRVNNLLKLLDMHKSKLTQKNKELLSKYKEAAKEYESFVFQMPVPAPVIRQFIKQGVVGEDLAITAEHMYGGNYLILGETRADSMVVFKLDRTRDGILARCRNTEDPQDLKAPLKDIKMVIDMCKKSESGSLRVLTEIDAMFHEIFEHQPKLMKFLMPELMEYHRNRNSDTYNACIAQHGVN